MTDYNIEMFADLATYNSAVELANKNTLVNIMTSELYNAASGNLSPLVAATAASAFLGAAGELMQDPEVFFILLNDALETITIKVDDKPYANEAHVDIEGVYAAYQEAGYLNSHTEVGDRFLEILSQRKETYAPALAEDGVCRRFGYAKILTSPLFIESIHALESTEFTANAQMVSLALQVQAKMGTAYDKAAYCLAGAVKMDANKAYVSEFKGDTRGREYQAACHGVNGQAGDRERAMMDLVGVTTDYNIGTVQANIMLEMADMCSVTTEEMNKLITEVVASPADFIVKHIGIKKDESQDTVVSKPWSFTKAAHYIVELRAGNKPYIGMAVGLDAKCSGPQLGALMVGDGLMAAACGFSRTQVEDAYQRAVVKLAAAGFAGWTRALVKKPFMGVFYGQGWAAFMNPNEKDEYTTEMWKLVHGADAALGCKERAVAFRNAILSSFGSKMMGVRMAITAFNNKELKEGAKLTYAMPDGFKVKMNYRVKVNALGEAIQPGVESPTVVIRDNLFTHKLQNMAIKTKTVATDEFVRTAFVNMIQATDALIARLIVVHLKRLGAQHIVSVHDCFRVNVTEMHLLEQAIKLAYTDLFGSTTNKATSDLPMGTDILALFFKGMNDLLVNEEDKVEMSQFVGKASVRRFRMINGVKVTDLINDLGTTYYFSK